MPLGASPWGAFDYASCDAVARHPKMRGAMASAQLSQYARRPFVTDILTTVAGHADRTRCELTRRFPKRTTSANSLQNLNPALVHSLRASCGRPGCTSVRPRIDCVANSRAGYAWRDRKSVV